MTDKEKAKEIAKKVYPDLKREYYPNDETYKDECNRLIDLRGGFVQGLLYKEEPVSKVWHDAWKEEPEKGRNILVKDANTNCCFVSSFEGRKSWEDTYQGYAFRLWAYIDDLLKI